MGPLSHYTARRFWHVVIADEAHRLKAPRGVTSQRVAGLASQSSLRLALTGTPLPHSHLDAWGLMRFIDVDVFGHSYARFRLSYLRVAAPHERRAPEASVTVRRGGAFDYWMPDNLDRLRQKMAPATVRVEASDVLDLPPVTDQMRIIELSPAIAQQYRAMERTFVARTQDGVITAANAAVSVMRLQQIASGRVRDEDSGQQRIWDRGKEQALADIIVDIPGPVVVFCRFVSDLAAVRGVNPDRDHFELSGQRRELDEWRHSDNGVLAVQIQAGGEGIDLTHARVGCLVHVAVELRSVRPSTGPARAAGTGRARDVYPPARQPSSEAFREGTYHRPSDLRRVADTPQHSQRYCFRMEG